MSRGAMNKDVKYYCTGCQEKEQELAELKVAFDEADALKQKYIVKHNVLYYEHENLKELVREYVDAVDNMYKDYDSWYIVHTRVKQAVTLANKDSKEEDK